MKKNTFTPANAPVNQVDAPKTTPNHPDQPAEPTAVGKLEYTEPVNAPVQLLPEPAPEAPAPAAEVIPEPAPEPQAPTAEVAPEPVVEAPAQTLSKAEQLAERANKLKQLNLLTAQLDKLQNTSNTLNEFAFKVEGDEDRRFATLEIRDDAGNRWATQNTTLCFLLTEHLKSLIAGKVDEKEAELLAIQL